MIYAIIITAAASGWAIYQTVVNRALVREVSALEYVYSFAGERTAAIEAARAAREAEAKADDDDDAGDDEGDED